MKNIFTKYCSYSITYIVSLAFAIGLFVALFNAASLSLFKPLPLKNAEQFHVLQSEIIVNGTMNIFFSNAHYGAAINKQLGKDKNLYLYKGVASDGSATGVDHASYSVGLFRSLGVALKQGRYPELNDSQQEVLVTESYIQAQEGSVSLNSVIMLNGRSYKVVGVVDSNAVALDGLSNVKPQLFIGQDFESFGVNKPTKFDNDLRMLVQEAGGSANVDSEVKRIVKNIEQEYISRFPPNTKLTVETDTLLNFTTKNSKDMAALLAISSSAMLLLILVNLFSVVAERATKLKSENTTRHIFGANTADLIKHVSKESLLLALISAPLCVGVLLAANVVLVDLAQDKLARLGELTINADVVVLLVMSYALVVFITTLILFLLSLPRTKNLTFTNKGTAGKGTIKGKLVLVGVKFFLASVLSMLFVFIAHDAARQAFNEYGFDANESVVVMFNIDSKRITKGEVESFASQLKREQPNSYVSSRQLVSAWQSINFIGLPNATQNDEKMVDVKYVEPQYLESMGLRLLSGAPYNRETGTREILVSQSLTEVMGEALVGSDVDMGGKTYRVTGVYSDIKMPNADPTGQPYQIYLPIEQYEYKGRVVLTVKNPADFSKMAIEAVVADYPAISIEGITTYGQLKSELVSHPAMIFNIMLGLLIATSVITLLGISSLLWFMMQNVKHELGVRLAYGATLKSLMTHYLKFTAPVVLVAVLIAIVALADTQLTDSLSVHITLEQMLVVVGAAFAVLIIGTFLPIYKFYKSNSLTELMS
ncbi:FtsX-like permease family protein [Pseudoalteromonas sp. CO325X]|uniref:ABC transporter permease n=1 Tax=Pseudoalteromonas sp. CO325X TaxID=1777262 RepID=UPI0010232FE6|nr:ABC transporter permease [Pseudoalteromonas sp. CO325X]RZF83275.1 FtsX-like permease family protein [Pseudoalteromonas sp. CO325X]